MSQTQYQVYDFAAAARVERRLWLSLNYWMQNSADLFVDNWSNFSASSINSVPRTIDAHEFQKFQSDWKFPAISAALGLKDALDFGMLVVPRKDLLVLLMDILGNSDAVEDRPLTSVEMSLAELILSQTAACIGQGWPEQETLKFELGKIDIAPNRSRIFASNTTLITTGLSVQLGESSMSIEFLLNKAKAESMLGIEQKNLTKVNPDKRISADTISEIEIDVRAKFGSVEVAVDDLVSLSVGDVLILNQSVADPLVVTANDEASFLAWPGRQKNKQVLQIVSQQVN